jgi:hypothetical protein
LFTYGLVCGALLRLRAARPAADAFRLPAGPLFALLGIAFCVVLILQMNQQHLYIVATVSGVAAVNWLFSRRRRA